LAIDAAVEALRNYVNAPSDQHFADAGPAILARIVAGVDRAEAKSAAESALECWLARLPLANTYPGIFGGLAGIYVGAKNASAICPRLEGFATVLRDRLVEWCAESEWRTEAVGWEDYDLISGPAGIILSLLQDPQGSTKDLSPAINQLLLLSRSIELRALRVGRYQDDEQRGWNFGRVNTGMAHGVTGIVAALTSAATGLPQSNDVRETISILSRWLVQESYVDSHGLQTWGPAGRDGCEPPEGSSRRQAWCYGTPGVAWTLWHAGKVLEEPELRRFASNAMRTFCRAFDEDFYIDDTGTSAALGICHGVAGTLILARCFASQANLPEAQHLSTRLEDYLTERLPQVCSLAHTDSTTLTGATGILAALLSDRSDNQSWTAHLGV
jgi:hypothetical protein